MYIIVYIYIWYFHIIHRAMWGNTKPIYHEIRPNYIERNITVAGCWFLQHDFYLCVHLVAYSGS